MNSPLRSRIIYLRSTVNHICTRKVRLQNGVQTLLLATPQSAPKLQLRLSIPILFAFCILLFITTTALWSQPTVFPSVGEIRLKNGLRAFMLENKTRQTTQPEQKKQGYITLRVQFGSGTALDAFGKEGSTALALHLLAGQVQMSLSTRTTISIGADASSFVFSVPSSAFPQQLSLLAKTLMQATVATSSRHLVQSLIAFAPDSAMLPTEPMANRVVFGLEHPYARLTTPERLKMLTTTDIQNAYKTLCLPNNTTFYCTGTIGKRAFSALLNKTFNTWQSGEAPYLPRPRSLPQENAVYAMEVPTDNRYFLAGNAKSRVALAFDAPMRNDMDYEAYTIASAILEQRLKSTLSTGTALRIGISRHKFANVLLIEQDIAGIPSLKERLETTRQAIVVLTETAPSSNEIQTHKKQALERFDAALHQPEALTALFAEAEAHGISLQELRQHAKRLQSLTPEAIQIAAKRYFQPERGIIVLGDSTTIASQTASLQTLGRFSRFRQDGEQILNLDSSDISWETLLLRHHQALGGTTATAGVTSLVTTTQTQLSAMAQKFPGAITTKQKANGKITRKLEISATQIVQELWCDGQKAFDKIEMMGQEQPLKQRDAKETESALFDAQIFPALTMHQCGFTAEMLGKLNGNYVVKASTANGTVKTLSFDAATYLLTSIEELRQTPQGIIKSVQEFREYGEFGGVKLPTTIVLKTGPGILIGKSTYKINPPLEDEVFSAPK